MRPEEVEKLAVIEWLTMKKCLYECTDPTFILNKYLHCWCQLFVAFQRRKVELSYFRSYHESIYVEYIKTKKKIRKFMNFVKQCASRSAVISLLNHDCLVK